MKKISHRQICGTPRPLLLSMYAKIPTDGSLFFLLTLLLLLFASAYDVQGASHRTNGRVIRVIDGDSLQIATDEGVLEVRLYGIDAPEYDQWRAKAGKRWLRGYLLKREVEVEKISTDQYNRQLAIVYRGGEAINGAAVRKGYAWVYSRYCHREICRSWKKK